VSPAVGVIDMHVRSSDKHVKTFRSKDAKGLVVAPNASDLGQAGNMTHRDGLENAIGAMKREGISDADVDLMMRKTPARLLGLSS
jgi:predicted metal-dependent phosphotriesterase family hydrolase